MNLLSVELISKSFGEKNLFSKLSFGVNEGQKVALIARNGSGKTSLLNILAGKDVPDEGRVVFRNELTVGYLDQDPQFPAGKTVEEAVFHSDAAIIQAVRKYEHAMLKREYTKAYQIAHDIVEMTLKLQDLANENSPK